MPEPDHTPDLDVTIPVAGPTPATSTRQEPDIPQPEELAALLPGENYTVESFLGAGGMGAVYKGTQVRLQRKVAIKIMRRDRAKDQGFEERFRREALAMAQLNHPNIVNVIDYGEAGADYLYIVMEFIDGTDLVNVIRSGEMTQETALKLLPQICDALQFAHDNGIVHRDIKPANILLTRDGRIKMADFGLAKRFDAENSYRTQSGYGMGTPDYAAPEQFMGDASVDHRADIYALGVMIYQMVTGTLPRGAWKPPSEKAAVDAFWDHIVARALQTDPHDRYASVSEIKIDLSGITPTTGAPRLVADGTQVGKSAGMTAAKGSTTALTQAGGRSAAKVQTQASQNDVQLGKSSKNRAPLLIAAALAVLGGGWFAWDKSKHATSVVTKTTPVTAEAIRLWDAADKIPKHPKVAWENGTLRLDDWPVSYDFPVTNRVAVRASIRMNPPDFERCNLILQKGADGGLYVLNLNLAKTEIVLQSKPGEEQKGRFLKMWPLPRQYRPGEWLALELRVDAGAISASLDGKLLGTVHDATYSDFTNFTLWGASHAHFRDIEVLRLDNAQAGMPTNSAPTSTSFSATRTWQAPAPTAIVGTEWTHLVPHIKPERDAIRGEWIVDEKGLQAKPYEWAFCNIPVQDPGTDYDLRYQVTRGEGSHLAMFFAFRKGNTGGYVPIDYVLGSDPAFADGLRWATIEDITNLDMRDPATTKAKRKEWLPKGKACTVLLQVREKEVIVSVDGEEAFRWPADWSKIQQRGGAGGSMFLDVSAGPVFGVGIFNCNATFHSIEMRKVEPVKDNTAPLPAITIGTEWTDIVPHIKPERDAVRGDWKSGKDGLACVNMVKWSLCRFPVQPPAGDYEVRYKLTRTGGPVDGLFFPFLHGNAAGSFAVDYPGHISFDRMRRVALQMVNGRESLEQPSEIMAVRKEWIPFGKTSTVLLQVGAKEVRVLVDDVEAIRWQADWSQIQQSSGGYPWAHVFQGLKEPIFGVGMFSNEVVYHSIEMRRVGEAKAQTSDTATKDTPSLSRLAIRSITPASPARLKVGEKMKLEIDFQNPGERVVHIWAHPLKNGVLSNLATTSGSFPTNEQKGTVERWFSYKEAGDADEVRVEMTTDTETPSRATIAKIVIPINVTWTDASKPTNTAPLSEAISNGVPFVNTLGMKFVPVPGTKVLFSIWHTRVMDYEKYAAARPGVDGSWRTQQYHGVPVGHEPDHPVVAVSWEDAQAFCQWLTDKETTAGTLPKGASYRLPTDVEWSTAVGLPPEQGSTPMERESKNTGDFPWGKDWPPAKQTGNYADETFHTSFPPVKNEKAGRMENLEWFKGYDDGFATTSPVGSFPANAFGLHDMGGNVWQWCEDWNPPRNGHVLRGASWLVGVSSYMRSSRRIYSVPHRDGNFGFRVVLEAK